MLNHDSNWSEGSHSSKSHWEIWCRFQWPIVASRDDIRVDARNRSRHDAGSKHFYWQCIILPVRYWQRLKEMNNENKFLKHLCYFFYFQYQTSSFWINSRIAFIVELDRCKDSDRWYLDLLKLIKWMAISFHNQKYCL